MHNIGIELHEIFRALSDPIRIRIIRLMLSAKSETCLCELSESLDEPEYKLSRHVKVLRSAGIITSVREGKWVYHGIVKDMRYLKNIYLSINNFPDDSKISTRDLTRFKKRLALREGGRCKTIPPKFETHSKKRVT